MAQMFELPLSDALPDFSTLAARITLPGVEPVVLIGRREDLREHLAALEREFASASALAFYHAGLTVMIRRGVQADLAYRHFEAAWADQGDHLLTLNARWLVAACDTIMTNAADKTERAIACVGSTLLNVVKLYETELLAAPPRSDADLRQLAQPRPLFDGMTSFSVGHGDMIFNLRERTRALCSQPTLASKIVAELIERVDRHDTVFSRLAALHVNPETRWQRAEQSESLLRDAPQS